MKKSKILAMVMLTAIFASAFSVATMTISPAHFVVGSEAPSVIDEPSVFHPDKMSYDNGTWAQLTTTVLTADGDLADWIAEGIIPEVFGGVTVYLAFDGTNVYVAATWADSTYSTGVSMWNKTDATDGFNAYAGDDDVITVGFDDGVDADFWTWTASNRTYDDLAYEHDGAGVADAGNRNKDVIR